MRHIPVGKDPVGKDGMGHPPPGHPSGAPGGRGAAPGSHEATAGVPRRSELRLTAQGERWRTRYRAPLFVNVLPCPGGGLLAAPVDQGGGLRNGERHLQRIELAGRAEVTWAPPASTLCLPGSGGGVSHLQLAARVGGGSYLRSAGLPLIPFAGAAVVQTTVVRVAAGGECLLVEGGCPGRTQMGEHWAFTRLAYRLTVLHDTRVVYRERWDLRPPAVPLAASGFGDYLGWGTCIACGSRAVAELELIRRQLAADGAAISHGVIGDNLAVARILDPHGYLVTRLAADVARAAGRAAA